MRVRGQGRKAFLGYFHWSEVGRQMRARRRGRKDPLEQMAEQPVEHDLASASIVGEYWGDGESQRTINSGWDTLVFLWSMCPVMPKAHVPSDECLRVAERPISLDRLPNTLADRV